MKRYKLITTFEEVKKVVDYCIQVGYASLDFETHARGPRGYTVGDDKFPTGAEHSEDKPTLLGICFQPRAGYAIPLFHKDSPFNKEQCLEIINYVGKFIVSNINVVKMAWNLKFEYKWFFRYGWMFRGYCMDGMLFKYLLEEERPHGLKDMVERFLPEYADYESEVDQAKKKFRGWGNIPIKTLAPYCVLDCDLTLRLCMSFEKAIIENDFYNLYRSMCIMQVKVLAESEMMGLPVDTKYLDRIIEEQGIKIEENRQNLLKHKLIRTFQKWRRAQKVKKLIADMNKEITAIQKDKTKKNPQQLIKNRMEKISRYIAGELVTKKERVDEVNFNSSDQMVDLLFISDGGFQFKIVKYTKDKKTKQPTDRPSTDEEVLLVLKRKDKSEFIDKLLSHRELSKLYSTYMVGMRDQLSSKSKIHGSFLIHGTVSGRLSSKQPNLQNIPRDTTSSLIKRMFIPPPGHLLLEVDYGQAELRVVAELAKEEAMIDIFRKNYNIHVATACKLNGGIHRYAEVKGILSQPTHKDFFFWEKQKKRGKVLNFSILYGQSDQATADQMGDGTTEEEAAELKEQWFREFPGIRPYMKQVTGRIKEDGFMMNLFGRKRRLPDIYSENKGLYNAAIREGFNAHIQGASSDFTQLATITIREKAMRGDLIWTDNPKYRFQAYTVHDSIGFFVQPKYVHSIVPKINKICSDPETLRYFNFQMKHVQMKVSPEVGTNWGALTDYNPWTNYQKLLDSAVSK